MMDDNAHDDVEEENVVGRAPPIPTTQSVWAKLTSDALACKGIDQLLANKSIGALSKQDVMRRAAETTRDLHQAWLEHVATLPIEDLSDDTLRSYTRYTDGLPLKDYENALDLVPISCRLRTRCRSTEADCPSTSSASPRAARPPYILRRADSPPCSWHSTSRARGCSCFVRLPRPNTRFYRFANIVLFARSQTPVGSSGQGTLVASKPTIERVLKLARARAGATTLRPPSSLSSAHSRPSPSTPACTWPCGGSLYVTRA
jgi:hypothetical protein